jgi:peptidyl-prolyl cis-trans isomerase B (cyclophilin B)
MIQGGDPNTKSKDVSSWGTGGPGYKIKAEFNKVHHERGVLSMARSAHPDSAGSQFFVVHGEAGFLDGKYTAFGRLTEGFDALDAIATAPCHPQGEGSRPRTRPHPEGRDPQGESAGELREPPSRATKASLDHDRSPNS